MSARGGWTLIHRLADLRWGIWVGKLDWEPLQVVHSERLIWGDIPVVVRILGTSHAVSLEYPGEPVHELLTCASPPPGSQALLAGEGRCQVDVGRLNWSTELKLAPLGSEPTSGTVVEASFPGSDGARTAVAVQMSEDELRIRSYHGYPEEGRALLGFSHVRRRRD